MAGQGGLTDGHPVDIYVHVKREQGSGGAVSTPGQMSEMTPGQRTPPRPASRATKKRYDGTPVPGEAGLGKVDGGINKQLSPIETTALGLFQLAKKWLPTLLGITTVAGILKKSSLFGATLEMLLDLFSVVMDVILMPVLLPLLQLIQQSKIIPALGLLAQVMMSLFGPTTPEDQKKQAAAIQTKGIATDTVTEMRTPVASQPFMPGGKPPKLQKGMQLVPQTMQAIIDPGERVLTAAENTKYLQEKGAPGATFMNKWNVTVTRNVDPNLIDDRVSSKMEREFARKYRRA